MSPQKPILVTGASGYIGNRLIPTLLKKGYPIHALGRSLEKLENQIWAKHPNVKLVQGDVLDAASLLSASKDCGAVFYLVHSMVSGQADFERADKTAAAHMVEAAEANRLERIIYLGGLGLERQVLSKHLRSRADVARILMSGKVPVTVFRAAMIIGSGSASFEILRYLVDRLPLMITPRWLKTPVQPIAIRNVIYYLTECLERDETKGQVFDIGGSDVLNYRELMKIYQEEAGLPKRWIIPVPVLTPRLSSYWINLVTPISAVIARPLAEGLRNPVVCQDRRILELIPQPLFTCREAIREALKFAFRMQSTEQDETPPVEAVYPGDPKWAGGTVFIERRRIQTQASSTSIWKVITSIGGENGWYHADWMWKFRAFLDQIAGGIGFRLSQRNPSGLQAGDTIDFWKVLEVEKDKRLILSAEMKLPGQAVLEFKILDSSPARIIQQTAYFKPKGLLGILYWFALWPFHQYVFSGMIAAIRKRSEMNQ